ncbi:armadillo-type protein [Piptocephalis cylindrospora]|uniref:26S proteasome regulatory subunit RPN1 n=1 Tax=Piptocephalis cylindrospora TaxID=1907219 RepID=A0A4P9Y863_9FUNG|nr:armadillo-type protein [Piptocephalis cylindrospora]|eukprot:RKP15298.1 armadillo-type protein [Piptocephalis cylindrospora]
MVARKDQPEPADKSTGASSSSDSKNNDKSKDNSSFPAKNQGKKDKNAESSDLSEEDEQLKGELEMLVERLSEPDTSLYAPSLEALRSLIRTSTSSMTSVPKPLKFLRPHYGRLRRQHGTWASGSDRQALADILSDRDITMEDSEEDLGPVIRESLRYRFLGTQEDPGSWGHEYVRHLAAEIGQQYAEREGQEYQTEKLLELALVLVPYFLQHNAEPEAVDLLLELEAIDRIVPHVDKDNFERVCLYILGCVHYLPFPEDTECLRTAHRIYRSQDRYFDAMKISIRLDYPKMIREDWDACKDSKLRVQMAFLLARQRLQLPSASEGMEEGATEQEGGEGEAVEQALAGTNLSRHYVALAKELDVFTGKKPEDIYKTHLENVRPGWGGTGGAEGTGVDSARQNLASSIVNGFLNAGYGNDPLIAAAGNDNAWIYRNKDMGMMSATASVGLIHLWNLDQGLEALDTYLYSTEDSVKAGAFLALGLLNSGIQSEEDPALALLGDSLSQEGIPAMTRVASIAGLGLAYAGTRKEEVLDLLLPILGDSGVSLEITAFTALSLGQIFAGSAHGEVASSILQVLLELEEAKMYGRFLALGLALLYLGKQEEAETTVETLRAFKHPLAGVTRVLVDVCAYAGTGNVLKVQEMLHICTDHIADSQIPRSDRPQAVAVLGIALLAMGEEVSGEMSVRAFNHLMHYGEPVIRRSVPLALGILHASNPRAHTLDTLSKYSHDSDLHVAVNAIFAMGLVGAGSNHARLAQMLRGLAAYYHKDPDCLFMVRISQGLLHMAKGTCSLGPYYSNREIMSPAAIAGLLSTVISFLDGDNLILGKNYHWMLYQLVSAIHPRFLITLDEETLEPKPVTVRVGQAVDTVGQAGKPKSITGFQTHTTPVLLGHSERAELGTNEYLPLSSNLEGFVLLRKNPEYFEEDEDQ